MIICEISQNFSNIDEAKKLIYLAKTHGGDLAKAQLFDSMKLYGKKVPAELSFCDAKALFNYGASIGIEVFFSVFDIERVKWCEEIGVKRYKLAFSQRDNRELIKAISDVNKLLIISDNTRRAYTTLYCVAHYPAQINEYSLNNWISCHGISDHTIGVDLAKIALAYDVGVEKHFCFNHDYGVDAPWSMTPEELRELKRFETVVKQVL